MRKKVFNTGLFFWIILSVHFGCQNSAESLEWPDVTRETKPWTRWWWHGSAVDKSEITAELESFSKAGLGGVEVTPIYGVYGYEDQFIEYLSGAWASMLSHTLNEGERLDVGVDMATGTGWPFGGPWIGQRHACKNLVYKTYSLSGGQKLNEKIAYVQRPYLSTVGFNIHNEQVPESANEMTIEDLTLPVSDNENLQKLALNQARFRVQLPLQTLMAYSENGDCIDLTDQAAADGSLDWTAPAGKWTLYAVFQGWHGKMVERAAPGGEGNVIDHFSKEALNTYLSRFDSALKGENIDGLRSFFNDSYEVDDAFGAADWTPEALTEFESRRGYDLRKHFPALLDKTSADHARVLCDFRETFSDMLLENFTQEWRSWAKSRNALVRNQAHGSPANIIDLYAASDIPETEGSEMLAYKLASSAAHLTGKRLTAAESATWLSEHFLSGWGDVKQAVDRFFLGGVNHIVYHGTAYSPDDEPFPGWLFYAAVHFNDRNPQWKDFSALNDYVTKTQSFLQTGKPDNDILVYYPVYDKFSQPGDATLTHFHSVREDFEGHAVVESAQALLHKGYAFDFVSDRALQKASYADGWIRIGDADFKTIVLPGAKLIPLQTFEKLLELARQGASVIAYKALPRDVPGLSDLEQRREKMKDLIDQISFDNDGKNGVSQADVGQGKVYVGKNLGQMLLSAGVKRETLTDRGLKYVRRKYDNGAYYFILNDGEKAVDGWVPLRAKATSAAAFNPMTGEYGIAEMRKTDEHRIEIYLQIRPGESIVAQTSMAKLSGRRYPWFKEAGAAADVSGEWTIDFVSGGPQIPDRIKTPVLDYWTELGGEAAKSFSGTARYLIDFPRPETKADAWRLDLGEVAGTAEVLLNGEKLATLIGPDYSTMIEAEKLSEKNTLEIHVSNLMANHIAYLDKRDVFWKKFYNINVAARSRENVSRGVFTAADWDYIDSGLKGPVKITPCERLSFD